MRIVVDARFDPKLWPISRELHPAYFVKIGDLSPFQRTLLALNALSEDIRVCIDGRIAFMAAEQANEVNVEVKTDLEFPAFIVKPLIMGEISEEDLEKLRSLENPSIVLASGEILGYFSSSMEIPSEGRFVLVNVDTLKIDDLPGVVDGRGAVDLGHYMVISDVEDARIVVTDDVAVVTRKENLSEVFEEFAKGERKKVHRTAYRPWGSYTVLEDAPTHKVKRITVLPKKRLSLQLHKRRSERWTVVRGTARVTLGNDVIDLKPGESVFIPVETPHRLENPSEKELLEVIEVQIGEYFGEDDIIRLQDDFGRGNEV